MLKRFLNMAIMFAGFLMFFGNFIYVILVHPEYTNSQILINYWKYYLAASVVLLLGALVAEKTNRGE